MATLYFHSIPVNITDDIGTSTTMEVHATKEMGRFVHRVFNPETGHTHERYFDTLRDFVAWHYAARGLRPRYGGAEFPLEAEVRVYLHHASQLGLLDSEPVQQTKLRVHQYFLD